MGEVMTKAEAYRLRQQTLCDLAVMDRAAANKALPWRFRYEAVVMAEVAREALADLAEVIRLSPEV